MPRKYIIGAFLVLLNT